MHSSATRSTRTFILRIWCEYLDATPPTWRGEIEDTETQHTTRFASLGQMNAIVHALSTVDDAASHRPQLPEAVFTGTEEATK